MKKCLIVLGMGRSGTSALMGVLEALGVEMGSGLIAPRAENPKGFFELADVVNINEKILNILNSSWDDLYLLPDKWWTQDKIFNECKEEISRILRANIEKTDILGLKDPRISRLLPLWIEIFEELNIKTYYIIPLRNPFEIANSLSLRAGTSLEKSILLWMNSMIDAELHTRPYPRVFTNFNDLLQKPQKTINIISNTLGIEFPRCFEKAKNDISKFLDINLKHFNEINIDETVSPEIFTFYNLLLKNASKEEKIDEIDLSKIDEIRIRYKNLNNIFYNQEIRTINKIIKNKDELIIKQDELIIKQKKLLKTINAKFIYFPKFLKGYNEEIDEKK